MLALTPPGRAATGWVADVAGFGEEPTLPQTRTVEGTARVVAEVRLADGTRYKVITKTVKGVGAASVCFQIDWPDLETRGKDSVCTQRGQEEGQRPSG